MKRFPKKHLKNGISGQTEFIKRISAPVIKGKNLEETDRDIIGRLEKIENRLDIVDQKLDNDMIRITFQSYCDDWGRVTTDDVLIDIKLVALLEKIFNKLFCSSIIITSGYRDYEFEMYLAGFYGYHNKGIAADIVCYDQNKKACNCRQSKYERIHQSGNK